MNTLPPRVFSTRRIVYDEDYDGIKSYEKLANLIKKYGCIVSKVSDGMFTIEDSKYPMFYTAIYFDIPIDAKETFLKELGE